MLASRAWGGGDTPTSPIQIHNCARLRRVMGMSVGSSWANRLDARRPSV